MQISKAKMVELWRISGSTVRHVLHDEREGHDSCYVISFYTFSHLSSSTIVLSVSNH